MLLFIKDIFELIIRYEQELMGMQFLKCWINSKSYNADFLILSLASLRVFFFGIMKSIDTKTFFIPSILCSFDRNELQQIVSNNIFFSFCSLFFDWQQQQQQQPEPSYVIRATSFFTFRLSLFCSFARIIPLMAHVIDEDETYTYEILHETHIEESAKLLTEAFTECNPLEVFLKVTAEELYAQALACSKAALGDQLSIVAVHKQTGEIHGLVQAGDATKLKVESFGELEWSKDIEVYEELERRFMEQYANLKENDLVEIMMLGVRQDCSRKGESSQR